MPVESTRGIGQAQKPIQKRHVRRVETDGSTQKHRVVRGPSTPVQTNIMSLDPAKTGMNILRSRHSIVDQRIDLLLNTLNSTFPISSKPREHAATMKIAPTSTLRVKQRKKAASDAQAMASSVQEMIAAGEYLEFDMTKAKARLKQATKLLEERRFEEARKEASRARIQAGKAVSLVFPKVIRTVTESIHSLENSGLELRKERSQLYSSSRAFKNRSYKDALLKLAECKKRLREAELRPALRAIFKARKAILAARSAGCDVGAATVLLNESMMRLKAGNAAEAETSAKRCLEASEEPMKLQKRTQDLLNVCARTIAVARGLGADVTEARDLVSQSHKLMAGNNFALAAECAKKGINAATVQTASKITQLINLAEMNIELARSCDISIEEAENNLAKAREALSRNEFANSLEKAYTSLFDSNTAIVSELQKRIKRFDQFAKELAGEVESFRQVQDAIDHSKDRSLETIRKYATLSEEIVNQAYENASAYARVSQDIMGQACESTVGISNDRTPAESDNASARTFSSVLGQVMSISNGDRRLRIIDAYLSGKLSASELDKLLAMLDANAGKVEIVPP